MFFYIIFLICSINTLRYLLNFANMNSIVKIPNVDRDVRIGSAFNHLFRIIFQTENIQEDYLEWDLSRASFFHPFFLAPLVIYKQSCGKNILCKGMPNRILSYLDLVCFYKAMLIDENMKLELVLDKYISKSYLPICQFELCKSNIDGLQSVLQRVIRQQSNADFRITTPLSYMIGEIVDNINEHSCARFGYIFSQYLKKERCIDLVIADDGITVYGSYAKFGLYQNEINGDEAMALKLANEGKSTKNLPDAENRGYGISSSKDMLVNGLNGSFFMLSGGAFHRYDTQGSSFVRLPKGVSWNGTIILMRIPVAVPENFNYEKYIF